MSTLQTILTWLDGKKTYIASILVLTVSYCGLQGWIDQNTQSYLAAIIAVIAGSAEGATIKLGIRSK